MQVVGDDDAGEFPSRQGPERAVLEVGLDDFNGARLPQIVEPEPPAKAKVATASAARPGKAAKGKTADTRVAAKDTRKGGDKLAAADTAKAPAKVAKAATSDKAKAPADKTKTVAAKPAAPGRLVALSKRFWPKASTRCSHPPAGTFHWLARAAGTPTRPPP